MLWEYTVLVVLNSLVQALAGQPASNACANVPLIRNFDIEKIMGIWHPHNMGEDEEVLKECVYYILSSDKRKSNVTVTIKRVWGNDKKIEFFKMYQIQDTNEFRINWLGNIRSNWLVASDYKSWSVWYICNPGASGKGGTYIATREPKRNDAVVKKAEAVLGRIDFGDIKPNMKSVDRSMC